MIYLSYIDKIKNGENLKSFSIAELTLLCDEIRGFLMQKVSETGGHLASNLGVVELTVALHYVYNFPDDKIIWDVGHQAYIHKILSGRIDEFNSLRKFGGMSGFPKSEESPYDAFNTGHASTSVSAALGFARARDILKGREKIVAVIGDGALGGGLAYEGINDADDLKSQMLIILNDNEMSISKNVGAMSTHLSSMRTSGKYFRIKQRVLSALEKLDMEKTIKFLRSVKTIMRRALINNTVFEGLGLTYFGPFDGHNLKLLIEMLQRLKNINKPVLMHIKTIKGKGYIPAENSPEIFHGVSKFDLNSGEIKKTADDFSSVFGKKLIEIAEKNNKVVAISAAMPDGTGLMEFAGKFPNRFFNVGIAEAHAVTLAAGMAKGGLVPVVSIYSSFMQRAFDSILHDICLQNLHVVLCADRAGLVGADGETHHGIFDISYTRLMPGLTVLAPTDYKSLREMLSFAINEANGPVFIRYPRGVECDDIPHFQPFLLSRAEVLSTGKDVCIFACGNMVSRAVKVSENLRSKGVFAEVINIGTIKPLDCETILSEGKKHNLVVTMEDNVKDGGIGEEISSLLRGCKVIIKAYKSGKITHGSVDELMKLNGFSIEEICNEILEAKGI